METLNNIEKITLLISVSVVSVIYLGIIMETILVKRWMKRFRNISLFVVLFMNSVLVKSQDTICLKDKTTFAAKIIEVGISEIKYKRLDNLTGPNYLSSKSDIFFIKYSNGSIDSVGNNKQKAVTLNSKPLDISNDKITIIDRKLIYNGRTVSDVDLDILINKCENPEKKALLIAECKKMKQYKANQRMYPPLIFATSFVILISTSPLVTAPEDFYNISYSQETMQLAAAGIIGAALTRITGFVIDKVNKNKRWNKRNEIAMIYNDFK